VFLSELNFIGFVEPLEMSFVAALREEKSMDVAFRKSKLMMRLEKLLPVNKCI
jgi:hypothetical protein